MHAQRQHARNSIVSNAVTRGRLHNNVVEWRKQAGAKPLRQVPAPKQEKPLVSARVENIFLALVAVATLLVAHATGLLALIAAMVGAL